MNIITDRVGVYKELVISEDSIRILSGLLDKEESLDLAFKLLLAARDLAQGYIKDELEEMFDKLIDNF